MVHFRTTVNNPKSYQNPLLCGLLGGVGGRLGVRFGIWWILTENIAYLVLVVGVIAVRFVLGDL
ncbi:MAG: hypothetical protein ABR962_05010 [Candidatus Bathyarchaeia archaeon]